MSLPLSVGEPILIVATTRFVCTDGSVTADVNGIDGTPLPVNVPASEVRLGAPVRTSAFAVAIPNESDPGRAAVWVRRGGRQVKASEDLTQADADALVQRMNVVLDVAPADRVVQARERALADVARAAGTGTGSGTVIERVAALRQERDDLKTKLESAERAAQKRKRERETIRHTVMEFGLATPGRAWSIFTMLEELAAIREAGTDVKVEARRDGAGAWGVYIGRGGRWTDIAFGLPEKVAKREARRFARVLRGEKEAAGG